MTSNLTPGKETTMQTTTRTLNRPSLIARLVNLLESRGADRQQLRGFDVAALIRIGIKSGLVSKSDMRVYLTM